MSDQTTTSTTSTTETFETLAEKTELRERLCVTLGAIREFTGKAWSAVRRDRELRIVLIFPALLLAVLVISLVRYASQDDPDTAPAAPAVPAPVIVAPPTPARDQRPGSVSTPTTDQHAAPPAPPTRLYRVTTGDTLASIALRHGVDYQRIAADNQLGNAHKIRPGQLLRIGQPTAGTVLIRPGDTLSRIAAATGTTVERLLALNPWITDPDRIPAGAGLRTRR